MLDDPSDGFDGLIAGGVALASIALANIAQLDEGDREGTVLQGGTLGLSGGDLVQVAM